MQVQPMRVIHQARLNKEEDSFFSPKFCATSLPLSLHPCLIFNLHKLLSFACFCPNTQHFSLVYHQEALIQAKKLLLLSHINSIKQGARRDLCSSWGFREVKTPKGSKLKGYKLWIRGRIPKTYGILGFFCINCDIFIECFVWC